MKIVTQLNDDGYYVGTTAAFESPLEPGVYHVPRGALDVPPPEVPEGKAARMVKGGWVFETIQKLDEEQKAASPQITPRDIILMELMRIDAVSIRALREAALSVPGAVERIAEIEAAAEAQRALLRRSAESEGE